MCSVGDDNLEEKTSKYMEPVPKFKLDDNKCNKCRASTPSIVLRGKDAYCQACFLAGTTHKFKAFLGKHRFVYPNDKVLVYHTEGHPSTSLLHFLRSGLDLSTPKKLRFEPVVIYIEDKIDLSSEERSDAAEFIRKQVEEYKFPLHYISLCDCVKKNNKVAECLVDDISKLSIGDNDKENLNQVLNSKGNATNKRDILKIYKKTILIEAAKHLGCKVVFTPELGIDIASQLLTNVSLGRGIHLALDVGICDNRDEDVKIVRPLRHFEIKELAMYNHFNRLEVVAKKEKLENIYSSVQSLMKNFVGGLQNNFPATITTIVRTGDKLAMEKSLEDNPRCVLCRGPQENRNEELTSAESTSFSHWVSTRSPQYSMTPVERYEKSLESFSVAGDSPYCFACERLSHDLVVS